MTLFHRSTTGEKIVVADDHCSLFYIIVGGEVVVEKKNSTTSNHQKHQINSWYFGDFTPGREGSAQGQGLGRFTGVTTA